MFCELRSTDERSVRDTYVKLLKGPVGVSEEGDREERRKGGRWEKKRKKGCDESLVCVKGLSLFWMVLIMLFLTRERYSMKENVNNNSLFGINEKMLVDKFYSSINKAWKKYE